MGPLRDFLVLVVVLSLAQSAVGVRRRLASAPERVFAFASPNYTIYHHQDDLLHEVEGIVKANPGFMKFEVLTDSSGEYKAELKVVTVEPGGFTHRHKEKVRLLMDFGEHGRELISSELGLLLLRTLADTAKLNELLPGNSGQGQGPGQQQQAARRKELERLLSGTVIKILPLENEGGRRLVESGKLCERKNGRGVDPNRNWLVDWGKKEPDYDPQEEYPGTQPFSEPESQMVRRVATEFAPHVWLNIHSGMEAMLAPWDHKAEIAAEAQPSVDILHAIQRDVMAGTSCVVGSGGKSVGYLAHGTATDYMHQVLKVPVAFTWEIYGDFGAAFDDCFRMFNPQDEKGVQDVLHRWLQAIMRLVELLPSHPALKDSKAWSLPAATTTDAKPTNSTSTSSADSASSTGQGTAGAGQGSSGGGKQGGGQGEEKGPTGGGAGTDGGQPGNKTPADAGEQGATQQHHEHHQHRPGQEQGQQQLQPGGQTGSGEQQSDRIQSGSTAAEGERGAATSTTQQQQQQQGERSAEAAPTLTTVVASQQVWGGGWSSSILNGLLALAGLAAVAVLATRCLARASADRRRARGDGHQTV